MFQVTFQDIGSIMGGAGALYAAIRGIPLLANQVKLAQRAANAEERAQQSEEAALAYQQAADGWKSVAEQTKAEVAGLRKDVASALEEAHRTQDDLRKTRELLAQAVLYITGLHTWMRLGGGTPPPQIPTDLRAEIDAILENKSSLDIPPTKDLH